jgi:hypothetical protein
VDLEEGVGVLSIQDLELASNLTTSRVSSTSACRSTARQTFTCAPAITSKSLPCSRRDSIRHLPRLNIINSCFKTDFSNLQTSRLPLEISREYRIKYLYPRCKTSSADQPDLDSVLRWVSIILHDPKKTISRLGMRRWTRPGGRCLLCSLRQVARQTLVLPAIRPFATSPDLPRHRAGERISKGRWKQAVLVSSKDREQYSRKREQQVGLQKPIFLASSICRVLSLTLAEIWSILANGQDQDRTW